MRVVGRLHSCLQLSSRCIALSSCLQPKGEFLALNVPWTPTVLSSRCSLLGTAPDATDMSTPAADAFSRREKAAKAAELRLQATATATAPATESPTATACRCSEAKGHQEASTTRDDSSADGKGGRKRPAQQVGFSDSDSDEVTCIGVSAAERGTQGCGSKGAASAGRDGGAASNKRGRTDGVSDETYTI